MPKVFIPNKSGHDYKDASRYGEIVYVTAGTQNKYSVIQMHRIWEDALKSSQADDMIVLTGLNIICAIGCSLFSHKHARINLLLWKNDKYIKREVLFDKEQEREA